MRVDRVHCVHICMRVALRLYVNDAFKLIWILQRASFFHFSNKKPFIFCSLMQFTVQIAAHTHTHTFYRHLKSWATAVGREQSILIYFDMPEKLRRASGSLATYCQVSCKFRYKLGHRHNFYKNAGLVFINICSVIFTQLQATRARTRPHYFRFPLETPTQPTKNGSRNSVKWRSE